MQNYMLLLDGVMQMMDHAGSCGGHGQCVFCKHKIFLEAGDAFLIITVHLDSQSFVVRNVEPFVTTKLTSGQLSHTSDCGAPGQDDDQQHCCHSLQNVNANKTNT
jgi:hypothetical protein